MGNYLRNEITIIDKEIHVGRDKYTKEHPPAPPASSAAADDEARNAPGETDGRDALREVIHSFGLDSPS